MKKLLLILLLLLPLIGFGQAVPNTSTFSLQDVYNAVSNHTPATSTNLQSCFTNAISGYFNPTYNQDSYAPANSMLRFRDYKPNIDCSSYIDISFFSQLKSPVNGHNDWFDFTGSFANAQTACTIANQSFQSGNEAAVECIRIESLTVGKQGYVCGISECQPFSYTGYVIYGTVWGIINGSQGSTRIVYFLNGVIQSITACS